MLSLIRSFFIAVIVLICLTISCYAQTDAGNIETYLNNYLATLPGNSGDDYTEPTAIELTNWETALTALFNGDLTGARASANAVNYQIVEYTDNAILPNQLYYIMEEKSPQSKYWGTYVFNSAACRANLVLQAPHTQFDSNTGAQAVYCFARLSAKALFLSGTHRCNHSTASTCDGTTGACGVSGSAFRISDLAHTTMSTFQKSTEVLASHSPNAIFVQLHGFSKLSTDPYVILSNGTRDTPTTDYVDMLKDELFVVDNTLTFEVAHQNLAWTRLIGFTNTQGRLLNGVSSPCNTAASGGTGRFVHVEQERTKLRSNATGWNKMYLALSNVFRCQNPNVPTMSQWGILQLALLLMIFGVLYQVNLTTRYE